MYSHVLATYQKTLLAFWAKTSKTMSAVAESFKGYQYYEFTVIKDLAEPSRLLAEMNSSSFTEKNIEKNEEEDEKIAKQDTEDDQTLIDITDSSIQEQKITTDSTEPVNALLDISDDQLDNQLLELEKLTIIDKATTTAANTSTTSNPSENGDNLVDLFDSSIEHDKLFADLLSPLSSETTNNNNNNNNNLNSDLLDINENNSFESNWAAAFGNISNQQQPQQLFQTSTNSGALNNNNNNNFLPSSLLSELLTSSNKTVKPTIPSSTDSKPKATTGKSADKQNWLDLFAELDPIQNPDAIGKSGVDEFDRNC
ncbi:unnamed protein product [Adineta steineri]|uniref:Islet cell autoantigen Ica1 C-terminal domain-containing protein n=1 Tax=Adineta steineri TaxID=433720 RepID=A0A818N685_9BILA|nr:unnamed protein product [Adineta steineri]